jgi:hypothetical protein
MSIIGSQKLALRRAFESGRRNGFWLAKNEPWKKESKDKSARLRDVFARKKQDDAMEGVSSMFDDPVDEKSIALKKRKDAIRAGLMKTERGRALLREKGITV